MEAKKPYNPSLGGAFTNDKFAKNGKDGIKIDITSENYDVLMKNLQIGSAILLRYNKVTQKGNDHYFVEMLPPMAPRQDYKGAKAAAASDID